MIKISDTDGVTLTLNNTLIISLPITPVEGYKTFCGIYNEISTKWNMLNSVNDGKYINCSIPSYVQNGVLLKSNINKEFYTISLFSVEDISDNNNQIVLILSIVIPSFFLIIAGIVGWKYYKKRREYHDISSGMSVV